MTGSTPNGIVTLLSDFGVVDPGLGFFRRGDGVAAGAGEQPKRVEGGYFVGQAGLGKGQRGGDAGEGQGADDLAVAGANGDRRLEALLGGDDVDRLDQTVALARIDAGVAAVLLADDLGGLRRLGLVGLPVERTIRRGPDQAGPGQACQYGAGQPVN